MSGTDKQNEKKKIKQGKEFRLVAGAAISNGVATEDLSEGNWNCWGWIEKLLNIVQIADADLLGLEFPGLCLCPVRH